MKLETDDWKKINGCLARLYRELDVKKHARVMLQVLNELVPVDSAGLNIFTPPNQLSAITLPEGCFTEEEVSLVAKYGSQSPYGAYYVATRDASWKMTTDFMPLEDFYKLDIYRHALAPKGINYQIGGILAMMEGTAYIITLHRTHNGFEERERDILNTLHPHLVTSYVNALACSLARDSVEQIRSVMETAPGAYGYFDASGKLGWMQPKMTDWLNEFFGDEIKDLQSIPQTIQNLLATSAQEQNAPKQFVKLGTTDSLTICLGASVLGGWILRLDRKPIAATSHFRPLPQLTARENEALSWMMKGKRNAEIASQLGISPRTVEKHVAQILTKLVVENRATAILRALEFCAAATVADE